MVMWKNGVKPDHIFFFFAIFFLPCIFPNVLGVIILQQVEILYDFYTRAYKNDKARTYFFH